MASEIRLKSSHGSSSERLLYNIRRPQMQIPHKTLVWVARACSLSARHGRIRPPASIHGGKCADGSRDYGGGATPSHAIPPGTPQTMRDRGTQPAGRRITTAGAMDTSAAGIWGSFGEQTLSVNLSGASRIRAAWRDGTPRFGFFVSRTHRLTNAHVSRAKLSPSALEPSE